MIRCEILIKQSFIRYLNDIVSIVGIFSFNFKHSTYICTDGWICSQSGYHLQVNKVQNKIERNLRIGLWRGKEINFVFS